MKITRIIKKLILFVLTFSLLIISFGCFGNNKDYTIVTEANEFVVGERFSLDSSFNSYFVYYVSSDEDIVTVNGYIGECLNSGACYVYAKSRALGNTVKTYFINVMEDEPISIDISGKSIMTVGEVDTLTLDLYPSSVSKSLLIFSSSDENIASVNSSGIITALSSGLVTIKVSSSLDESIFDELVIFVKEDNSQVEEIEERYIDGEKETIDISDGMGALQGIIDTNIQYIVGVLGYTQSPRTRVLKLSQSGTGVVYKRTYILSSGEEVSEIENNETFKNYKYYVITNKHLVNGMTNIKVVYNSNEISAKVIASDSKIDISVITFELTNYIPVCKFGNSDEIETGDFVLAIGNAIGDDNTASVSFGIVSYAVRYVDSDTDGDGVRDWDALYIQHDAAVTNGTSGGSLVNLKGEVIGINSIKISDDEIDNMAFSIPINTVLSLVSSLEKGIVPVRPLLGVSIVMVKDIINQEYTDVTLPDGISYGCYIAEVTSGGVASVAGVEVGDIILEFNGVKIFYSYEIRAALNKIIVGSGDEVSIIVYRDGKEVELKAVF